MNKENTSNFKVSSNIHFKVTKLVYLDQDGVAAKELEFFHGVRVKSDDGVVVVYGLVNNESIRSLLALQNRGAEVSLRSLAEKKITKKKNKSDCKQSESEIRERVEI